MRALAAALVLSLSMPSFAGMARADTAGFGQSVDAAARRFPGGAAIWVADPAAAQPMYAANADEPVIAASLYKLGILLHIESAIQRGELTYDDTITIEDEDVDDYSYEASGTVMSLDDALEMMITYSDNASALAFWRVFGGASVNATLIAQGIEDFHVAEDADEDNFVTARALGTFFRLLATRQLVSAAASDRMLARLVRQHINDRLPSRLSDDVVVAHKTGNLVGLVHDAGIMYTPQGPRVIVVLTWDALDDDANAFIGTLGSLLYGP